MRIGFGNWIGRGVIALMVVGTGETEVFIYIFLCGIDNCSRSGLDGRSSLPPVPIGRQDGGQQSPALCKGEHG